MSHDKFHSVSNPDPISDIFEFAAQLLTKNKMSDVHFSKLFLKYFYCLAREEAM